MLSDRPFSISGICERDIDLLLLEEFRSNPDFATWFTSEALRIEPGICSGALRSVTDTSGESDLEVEFRDPSGRTTRVLIENKIAESFQPRQALRYAERAASYRDRNECQDTITVLVAPAAYIGSDIDHGFQAHVTYESIRDWFRRQKQSQPRAAHKADILDSAIEKSHSGYNPIEDAGVTGFWKEYWELASREAPELEMREPPGKPSGSGFVNFRPPDLPVSIRLRHKLVHGNVDLEFKGFANRLAELRARFGDQLQEGMILTSASQSGVVRIKVPAISPSRSLPEQIDAVREGLRAAQRLLAWYRKTGK
ncbi:MAG: hypothetical protein ABI718_15610 [Acidobacteriota bacterium]